MNINGLILLRAGSLVWGIGEEWGEGKILQFDETDSNALILRKQIKYFLTNKIRVTIQQQQHKSHIIPVEFCELARVTG